MTPEDLYRRLYLIRRVEEEIARVYPSDKIQSPVHLSIGQELASVAVCAALRAQDKVLGSYRGHALYLAKGGDLRAFVAELFGKVTGCARGKGGSMHLVAPAVGFLGTSAIVGSQIPVAVGVAIAQKIRGTGAVTAVFFGDGAAEEGCFAESLNLAALYNLPLLFVCENNGYAIVTPLGKRQATPLALRAGAFGVPSVTVTEYDETFTVAAGLVSWIRDGGGPKLLEVRAPRLKEHVGPNEDWTQGYREPTHTGEWDDPVLRARGRVFPDLRERIERDVDAAIADAFAFAEASAVPGPEDLLVDTYG